MSNDDVPLFQERWRFRPFWMLVGCVLVNRTRWTCAESVHAQLMQHYPSPGLLSRAEPAELEMLLAPLGLSGQRSRSLIGLAAVWSRHGRGWHRRNLTGRTLRASYPGCGKYAADSWDIFIRCSEAVRPTDKRLLAYLRRTAA